MAYNEITSKNSPNYTPGRQGTAISGITIHWWGDPSTNPTIEGVASWLCNPAAGTSAHIIATGAGRKVYQIVNDADTAWHAGTWAANLSTIGIECDPRCRQEDYDVVAEVIADLWRAYGKLPLYPHKRWFSTACPGNYDISRLQKLAEQKYSGKSTNQGGDGQMLIGSGENWYARCNDTHIRIRGRVLSRATWKKFIGVDFLHFVEACSDDPEAQRVQQWQELGKKATNDKWSTQIASLKKQVAELGKRPTQAQLDALKTQVTKLSGDMANAQQEATQARKDAADSAKKLKDLELENEQAEKEASSFLTAVINAIRKLFNKN